MPSVLTRLSEWYVAQCDDLWEHRWGLSITTIDNPGFALSIDLTGTPLEDVEFIRMEVEIDTLNGWYVCWKEEGKFQAAGAPSRIEDMIECFLNWASTETTSTAQ